MRDLQFNALVLKQEGQELRPMVERLGLDALPSGDVLVRVDYSSINYKDAMAIGNRGIIRRFPAVPGIDLAGEVVASEHPGTSSGDKVIITGWGMGERFWGGYSQYARVQGDWTVPLPRAMTARQAMALGTAGLTAMLSVMALEKQGLRPGDGEILVTGATGGVGSVAILLLSRLGFQVTAMTGKPEWTEHLKAMGASRIVGRDALAQPSKPGRFVLEPESFAGAVDTVGGDTLASIIARLRYGGAVAACGLVGGVALDTHVFPFILRGVSLLGIDSVRCPAPVRREAWERLSKALPAGTLDGLIVEIGLDQVVEEAEKILAGQACGRVLVDLWSPE